MINRGGEGRARSEGLLFWLFVVPVIVESKIAEAKGNGQVIDDFFFFFFEFLVVDYNYYAAATFLSIEIHYAVLFISLVFFFLQSRLSLNTFI